MIDDPLEWLSLSLQEDEPTIPDHSSRGLWCGPGYDETDEALVPEETGELDADSVTVEQPIP